MREIDMSEFCSEIAEEVRIRAIAKGIPAPVAMLGLAQLVCYMARAMEQANNLPGLLHDKLAETVAESRASTTPPSSGVH